MAEGFVQQLSADTVEVHGAGSQPTSLHPNAVRVMAGYGVDLTGRRAKHLSEFSHHRFDCVVTLRDRVREVCPEFPGHPESIHWSVANPSDEGGSDEKTLPAFQRVAADLAERILFLLKLLASVPGEPRRR
jgi:ArsR family transcriptional regulator, arsenate/arsenite/antimonite-responsive transcriptional repressor / arsenate reductase (thioredoxin)